MTVIDFSSFELYGIMLLFIFDFLYSNFRDNKPYHKTVINLSKITELSHFIPKGNKLIKLFSVWPRSLEDNTGGAG